MRREKEGDEREERGKRESERDEERGGKRRSGCVSPHHVLFPSYMCTLVKY